MKRKRSSLRKRKRLQDHSLKIICQGFRSEDSLKMEMIALDAILMGLEILREGVQTLEYCRNNLDQVVDYERQKLIHIFSEITPDEIRDLLPLHFVDGEVLIELIERSFAEFSGNTHYSELLSRAKEDFKRLHAKFLIIKIDMLAYLVYIEHKITGIL
ncbi:hypothetical protein TNIN_116711 [Trichonephila inaurata madagascariensis]|uniref:Uncharacterized protein n=1 Tax=Trichonephila inaurata madagascariensis TaxID=2747483 RepID=A0A8X6YUU8_9ARAC|nr:hypothetical protein TNIN_116711 [Trichonephila inaurata madagascariensis]